MGISLDGADTATFFAPPLICSSAFSMVVKIPVHSATTSTPTPFQFKSEGFFIDVTLISFPLTTKLLSLVLISSFNLP